MSTDTDTFEHDLAARMGAAASSVAATGVARDGVDDRLAARAVTRRRRLQGGIALAAAALVVAAGLAAITLGGGGGEPEGTVFAGQGRSTSTEAPTTECIGRPPAGFTGTLVCGVDEGSTATTGPPDTVAPAECPGAPDPILPDAVDDGGSGQTSCVGATTAPATTTAPPATTEPAPTTTLVPSTAPPATTAPVTTTTSALAPGQACTPGSSPDCIDPEGDGSFVYLIGGADCMASPIGGPMCTDLDGDGVAGYPDQG